MGTQVRILLHCPNRPRITARMVCSTGASDFALHSDHLRSPDALCTRLLPNPIPATRRSMFSHIRVHTRATRHPPQSGPAKSTTGNSRAPQCLIHIICRAAPPLSTIAAPYCQASVTTQYQWLGGQCSGNADLSATSTSWHTTMLSELRQRSKTSLSTAYRPEVHLSQLLQPQIVPTVDLQVPCSNCLHATFTSTDRR